VSRGPAPTERASLQVTLGTAEPSRAEAAQHVQSGRNGPGAPEASNPGATAPLLLAADHGAAARVGDRVISMEEVDREWRRSDPASYLRLTRQVYDRRRHIVETMVSDDLLAREAAARGVNVEALLAEDVPKRIIAMPDSAVISLYQSLGDNTRGATLEQMRPALRAWLERHSAPEIAKMSFIEELKKVSTRAEILLEAPRVQIERTAQDVALGPSAAPVEIVAFGDFQSAEYARFAQAFPRVRDTFGDRIRFVFKNLPALGPQSVAAAEAALCANAQGRFWAYHDALVAPGVVNGARLTASAAAVGLKGDAFSGCIERREFRDAIRKALDEADRYGIQASPSFLVNGRLAPPPPPFLLPYDYFKLLIEEELGRLVRR
jgi:protein-disulfide isomerase